MIDDTIKKDTEVKEPVISEPKTEPEVTDIDLGFVEKKKFRINGGNSMSLTSTLRQDLKRVIRNLRRSLKRHKKKLQVFQLKVMM